MILVECKTVGLVLIYKKYTKVVVEGWSDERNEWLDKSDRLTWPKCTLQQIRHSFSRDCDTIIHDDGED